jgi:hypothetical protein
MQHAIRFATKTIQVRRDIEHNPQIWAILLVVCTLLLPHNHLTPTEKPKIKKFPGGKLCVSASIGFCIHWMVQNTKKHPFLIYAGSVYTISISFLSFFKLLTDFFVAGRASSWSAKQHVPVASQPFFYFVCIEVYLVLIGWAAIPGWMPL